MNEFTIDFYQNILTLLIIIISFSIVFLVGVKDKHDINKVVAIFIWHTFFSIVYFVYTLSNQADARKYYRVSLTNGFDFSPGTKFIYYITSFPTQILDASYINTALFYNFIGVLGLVFLYKSLKYSLVRLPWYWVFVLFIPSMSFWSGGLGKDAISFCATCLFLYAITTSKKTTLLAFISFVMMFMVRPHIAALMLVSYVIYFVIQSKTHLVIKALILPFIGIGVFLSIGFVQQYIGLEDASLDNVTGYIDERQVSNLGGGSSLDIASMSYPMQMFTYVFRPLPFEAHNIVSLVTAIENTAILFLFLYILLKIKFDLKIFVQGKLLWLFMYAFLTCTILAVTTANLGIATRQKWMFMPVLLYLLIFAFCQYRTNNNRVNP